MYKWPRPLNKVDKIRGKSRENNANKNGVTAHPDLHFLHYKEYTTCPFGFKPKQFIIPTGVLFYLLYLN